MKLNSLSLTNFRNYASFFCEFDPGINLIIGDNAQGKTNLLEAVAWLSSAKSFRAGREQELIRFQADFCEILAETDDGERVKKLRALLFPGRRPRQLFIGGVKQKTAAEWKEQFHTVLFCPEDLLVLKGGAAGRRRLLDDALCQLRPAYDTALTEYRRLLEHKNRILKDYREQPSLLEPLPEFNEQLARFGALIVAARAGYLRELEKYASGYHGEFSGGREKLELQYETVSTVKDLYAPKSVIYEQLREHQRSHYHAELESGQCLSGPHKDDFSLQLDGLPVRSFGSQGQVRTATISLKLAEREIFRQDVGCEPVLLLDDVLSELDAGRQDFILNRIQSGQVFITCCEKDRMIRAGKVITIENGALRA